MAAPGLVAGAGGANQPGGALDAEARPQAGEAEEEAFGLIAYIGGCTLR
jgi:hypothetical protein